VRRVPSFPLYEGIALVRALNVIRVLCNRHRSCPPEPIVTITIIHHHRGLIAPGCNTEEAGRAAPKRIYGSGGIKAEKAYQDEKGLDTVKSTTFFRSTRVVKTYQHPFYEVGSTLSIWTLGASHLYLGAVQLRGSWK
jgi:hypothetical protein